MVFVKIAAELVHGADEDAADGRADDVGVDLKGRGEVEAPLAEAEIVHQGMAYVADAEEHRAVAAVRTQN